MNNKSGYSPIMLAYLASDKLNCVHDPTPQLKGALFIGNLEAAQSMEVLKKHSIKAVLTAAYGTNVSYQGQPYVQDHLVLLADDIPSYDMTQHFNEGIQFIHNNRKKGHNILVHCHAGISRSATLVLAYLLKTTGWSLQKCLKQVRKRRPIVQPNPGFLKQLSNFQKKAAIDGPKMTSTKVNVSTSKKEDIFKRPASMAPREIISQKYQSKTLNNVKEKEKKMQQQLNDLLINKGMNPIFQKKQEYKIQQKKQQKKAWGRDVLRSEPKINKTMKEPLQTKDIPLFPNRNKTNYHFAQNNVRVPDSILNRNDIPSTLNKPSYPSKLHYRN